MAIRTRDQLIDALGNNLSTVVIDKASIITTGQIVNHLSLWRATGQPAQGAIPTTAAVCNNTLVGGVSFTQQTSPASSYAAWATFLSNQTTVVVEMHDRLMHMGGLNGTLTTAQSVNLDLSTNLAVSNLSARIGDSNYNDVSWWLEWYTQTGTTAVTANVAVTCNDNSTPTLSVPLAGTRPASQMINLNVFLPAISTPRFIRSVQSVTLSASTTTAGNFGVTATRQRFVVPTFVVGFSQDSDWSRLGLPEIHNSSCLFPVVIPGVAQSGTLRGSVRIAHG